MAEPWPDNLRSNRRSMSLRQNSRAYTSSLSNAQQIVSAPGAYWQCSMTFSVMTREKERKFSALFGRLRGMVGTVNVPDWNRERDDDIGQVTISSALAYSATMVVAGITRSGVVFREGDRITAAGQLYEVVQDVVAAGGVAELPLNRLIRSTIPVGTPVEYNRPYCEMRLSSDVMNVSISAIISSGSFDFREAF